ncbi:aspartate aminotransferase family protein [Oleomonas cavernae]|uniref:Acetylornithine aminotransferase n=1 Tax=Oleomonas cavernae TaxID=2320859 RepID=A0A418VUI4_9PROT|nr:aspartate aminotransferase family protein [Oleomonas cavernae]RJF80821.1 aspartate aminotransferase family protein [Oleomonas cavernae]
MTSAVLPTYARADLAFEKGEGAWLVSTDGRRFLDFAAGIAVNALGHAHPHLVKALTEQAGKLWHTSNMFRIPGQERLAERLTQATFADLAFFTNSGAEAVECAIKMARKYHSATGNPQRYRLITFEGAFHGRTLATIAAGGQKKHLDGFGPPVDGFDQVPFGDLEAVKAAIGPQTAGLLFEPIQGEGGINPIPDTTLRALRQICDEHGILMVLDEVQCGMGRTGKLFAHEWAGEGAAPDIMAVAKAIGGGFPLGACLATAKAAVGMVAGSHGSTYGGNPLAMAVGNAVLDVMLAPDFLPRVNEIAGRLRQSLAMIVDSHPDVVEGIRGKGLMLGLKVRDGIENRLLLNAMRDAGLLGVAGGDNTIRLLPPLIITDEDVAEATKLLDSACAAVSAQVKVKAAS